MLQLTSERVASNTTFTELIRPFTIVTSLIPDPDPESNPDPLNSTTLLRMLGEEIKILSLDE